MLQPADRFGRTVGGNGGGSNTNTIQYDPAGLFLIAMEQMA